MACAVVFLNYYYLRSIILFCACCTSSCPTYDSARSSTTDSVQSPVTGGYEGRTSLLVRIDNTAHISEAPAPGPPAPTDHIPVGIAVSTGSDRANQRPVSPLTVFVNQLFPGISVIREGTGPETCSARSKR